MTPELIKFTDWTGFCRNQSSLKFKHVHRILSVRIDPDTSLAFKRAFNLFGMRQGEFL
jgi:hypothetical protein